MYSVRIRRGAVKDLARLPKDYVRLIRQHIRALANNPRPQDAKQLEGTTDYSMRVGVYRILYIINDDKRTVTVYRIKHRREAYR